MKFLPLILILVSSVVLAGEYDHNRFKVGPTDIPREFEAFVLSFDGLDDDNKDGKGEAWGIPEWVAFEIKKTGKDESFKPRSWSTDKALAEAGIAPTDDSYKIKGAMGANYRVTRGHMCSRETAGMISKDASIKTHTFLNAIPQLQGPNAGIWALLEKKTREWATDENSVWVITGPVFTEYKTPSLWLGNNQEFQVAVPDFLFKIVIRKAGPKTETLAFLMPNFLNKNNPKLKDYLTSIETIEKETGLTVHGLNRTVKKKKATKLW